MKKHFTKPFNNPFADNVRGDAFRLADKLSMRLIARDEIDHEWPADEVPKVDLEAAYLLYRLSRPEGFDAPHDLLTALERLEAFPPHEEVDAFKKQYASELAKVKKQVLNAVKRITSQTTITR